MPRSGWFAAGATAAALLGPTLAGLGVAPALVLAAGAILAVAAVASVARDEAIIAARRAGGAALVGLLAVAMRLAVGSAMAPPAPEIPQGEGPWDARVEVVGAPRDGQQTATLRLVGDARIALAASLPRYPELKTGDVINVSGAIEPPPDGGYGDWLRRTGVLGTIRSRTLEQIGRTDDAFGALAGLRSTSDAALRSALPEPAAGLASGILVGLRERVDRDLAAAFTTAGVSHVVAISGWNIAIVGATIAALLRGRRRRTRAVVTLVAIVAYTAFAGASASVVRAAAMAGVALLARESGRAGRAAAALGLACGVLLVVDPGLVRDAGFQLSVLATAGLLVWATSIREQLDRSRLRVLPGWVLEALALSTAAQVATLPVVLASFGRLSLVSPVANLAVAPIVPIAMATGALAMAGGWIGQLGGPQLAATILGIPAWLSLGGLIETVRIAAAVPLASVTIPPPVATTMGLVAGGLALGSTPRIRRAIGTIAPWPARATSRSPALQAAEERTRSTVRSRQERYLAIVLAGAVVVLAAAAANRPDGHVRVSVLDVGQGDAILVEGANGGRLLVDGGPDPDRLLIALDAQVPAWDRRIDILVLSHPHEDHVAGLPVLLERYRVGRVVEPGMRGPGPGYHAWTTWLAGHGVEGGRLGTGDRLALDGIDFRVLWPDPDRVPLEPPDTGRAINDVSIVLFGQVGTGRFLLMGDVEDDIDPILVGRGLPRVDVLKVAHHGSRTATTQAFLEAVGPAVAVASAGAGNPYGHPAPSTMTRIEATGARALRTDRDGTVTATYDGRAWNVTTERRVAVAPRVPEATLAWAGPVVFTCRVPRPTKAASPTVATTAPPTAPPTAGPVALGYHRHDARPDPSPDQLDAPFARPAGLAPAPFESGGGGRCLARRPSRRSRPRGGSRHRRGRGAAPRRRQAAAEIGPGRGPPTRRRRRRMALACGLARARACRRGPPRHTARRAGGGPMVGRGAARCPPSRLRRQARRDGPRLDGGSVRGLGPSLSRRLGRGDGARGPRPGASPRSRRVQPPGDLPGRRAAAPLDEVHLADGRTCGSSLGSGCGISLIADGAVLGCFWGDDGYGLGRRADALAERLTAQAGIPPERRRTTGAEADAGRLEEWLATAPLFGGGTLVVVTEPGPLVRSAAQRTALAGLFERIAPGNGLVFIDPVDGSAGGRRPASHDALRDAVKAAGGETAELKAPTEGRLAAWIEDRARERSIRLGQGAARELGTRVGGFVREGDVDRRRMGILAVGELEKLALYRPDGEVTVDDVRALVPEAVPSSSWAFLDAVGLRDMARAGTLLPDILNSTPEPVLITQLHRRLRELIEVADHLQAGATPGSLVRTLGQKPFRVEKLVEQARRWTVGELIAALDGVLALDERIKGLTPSSEAQRRLAVTLWLAERVARPAAPDGAGRDGHANASQGETRGRGTRVPAG